MVWNCSPIEILADEDGFCRGVRVKDTVTSEEREIPKGVFIALGSRHLTLLRICWIR